MTVANINGVDMYYEVAGQGEAVVFLHGMTGSTQDWANQIRVLSPNYMVVTRDMRGHGKSAAPPNEDAYSIPIFAEDVFGLLNQLNIQKCCLVGHSVGGFIALQFALKHQDRLAALVLVDTAGGQIPAAPGAAELRQKLEEIARSQGVEAAFEYDAANNPSRIERFKKHPEQREIAKRKVLMTSVNGYVLCPRGSAKRETLTSRLPEIKIPTLIYWGEEDAMFTEAVQVLNKGIPDSELVTVKGVGHSPHEEAPEIFNETLLKFLGKVKW